MLISLSEIMNSKSDTRDVDAAIGMDNFEYMGRSYSFSSRQPVRLSFSNAGTRTIRLIAGITVSLSIPCDRCLEPVEYSFDISEDYKFILDEAGDARTDEDDETVNYIHGYELDTDAFVREELMIGFPMKVLCSEECKGICTVCGANLNRGECGCDRTVLDPRMSIIRDLFRQKEV